MIVETDGGIGDVEFFFDHQVSFVKEIERDGLQNFIAWLDSRAVDVGSAGIFKDRCHEGTPTTAMRWLRTCSMVMRVAPASVAICCSWPGVNKWICSGLSSGTDGTLRTMKR